MHRGRLNRSSRSDSRHGYKPAPGSVLPQSMRDEIENQGDRGDDRKFSKPHVNRAATRKEKRKMKKLEKAQRRFEPVKRSYGRVVEKTEAPTKKRQKPNDTGMVKVKKPIKSSEVDMDENTDAFDKLSRSNPTLYSRLESDGLVESNMDDLFKEDDRNIAYWEKKLGLKKNQKLGKSFKDDGLLYALGLDSEGEEEKGGEEDFDRQAGLDYLAKKRKKMQEKKSKSSEALSSDAEAGLSSSDDDEGMDDLDMELFAKDDSDMEKSSTGEVESDVEMNLDEEEDDEDDEENREDAFVVKSSNDPRSTATENATNTTTAKSPTKYIPPHLRKKADTKSEQLLKLERRIRGLFNRLSESNMESVLWDIEKCYNDNPRHDVTCTITDIILSSISQKSNLLDSFVITYATIVSCFYQLIGIEFAAHFVQTLVETFEKHYKESIQTTDIAKMLDAEGEDQPTSAKEAKNLLTLALELYNFEVISCILIYDVIKMFIKEMDEFSVELLLKILNTSGAQLRSDDASALKDIVGEIQKQTDKKDPHSISIRYKFMLETINNIKNNKIRKGPTAGGVSSLEMILKMKKFINGIHKKRVVRSVEPLRVSLQDIHDIDTKGKWWLVGASWKDNLVGTESKHATNKIPNDLKNDQAQQNELLKLAKKQGMNTDIRRSIFITIMTAEDYVDAFENLTKLSLNEVQQREIARVLLQCAGNEKVFNPYYMLLCKRFCEMNYSFRVTFQYCLWDFMREMGESEVGGLDRSAESALSDNVHIRLGRIVNIAKLYAALIASHALSLLLLKSVNFLTLKSNGRIFLETMFANLMLHLKKEGTQGVTSVFEKISAQRTLAQGCILFMQESVVPGHHLALNDKDMETVRWGCKIANQLLSK